jgi:hypothetical protein
MYYSLNSHKFHNFNKLMNNLMNKSINKSIEQFIEFNKKIKFSPIIQNQLIIDKPKYPICFNIFLLVSLGALISIYKISNV